MTIVAAGASALVVWLLVTHPGSRRVRMRLQQRETPVRHAVGDATLAGSAVLAAGMVALLGWGAGPGAATASMSLVLVTGVATGRTVLRARMVSRRAADVARACDLIGSLVAIGHIPSVALVLAAEDCSVLEPVAAAHRVGADVPAALRAAGSRAGGKGLVRLAQAWEVGERTGAPLGQALGAVAEAVRRDREIEQVVVAELAGPRASGQVLGLLPIVGLAAAVAMGAQPAQFFLTGILGPICLVLGTGLACAGVFWTEAMVSRATPGTESARERRWRGGPG